MNPPTFRRFLLATVAAMALFGPLSAWAETDGDWEFSYSDSDSTATITKYRGTSATPNVPSKVSRQAVSWEDGRGCTTNICTYTVTALGSVFSGNGNITSVSIPSTITELNGFFLCSNLVSISCSVPPTRIGSYAFVDCSRLKTGIDLSQCTYIGTHSFYNCQSLELGHLSLPNATNIDAQAFDSCQRLTSIELPSKLRYLGGGAFQRCQSLEWARIDGTDLDVSCLSGCANLQSVVLGDGVTSAGSFVGCSSLRTLDVGSGLTVVSSNICKDLRNLESVTFRGNIQKIEEGAFSGCSNLVSFFFGGAPLVIGNEAFYNCRLLKDGDIDLSHCTSLGSSAFYGCSGLTAVELPSSLRFLGSGAFRHCGGLTSARIDGTDLTLPCYVLANCSNLQSVVIGDGVVGVEENKTTGYDHQGPFHGSLQLKTLDVGTGMTAVSNYFCCGLSGLKTATFRGNIQSIGNSAFSQCTNLVSVSLGGSPKTIGGHAFSNCQQLEGSIDLSQCTNVWREAFDNCERLGGVVDLTRCANVGVMAFSDCSALAGVEFSSCLTNIGGSAFSGCGSLRSVDLPPSLKSLGGSAFSYCGSLTNARIDGTELTLPMPVLAECGNLERVTIGDGVIAVAPNPSLSSKQGPFSGCGQLRTLDVGTGMKAISDYFCNLPSLEHATFRGDIQQIGTEAFSGCTNLLSVALGGAPKTIGESAFYNCRLMEGEIDLSQCSEMGRSAFSGCEAWEAGELELAKLACVNDSAFYRCNGLTGIKFGRGLTNVGSSAFAYCAGLSNVWFKGGVPGVGSGPFSGVASGAWGYYEANHREEWTAVGVIGADGKWQGLIMGEIPVPVLDVAGANTTKGSMTLGWKDEGGGEGVTYSVYRSANDSYSAADRLTNGLAATTWTDNDYWSAEPVLKPLNYWVVADGGGYGERESNRVETRRRHGILVGLGSWSAEYRQRLADEANKADVTAENVLEPLPGAEDANNVSNNAVLRGGFANGNIRCLVDAAATCTNIDKAFADVASNAIPGDICLFYIATHGGVLPKASGGLPAGTAVLSAYDDDYDEMRLAWAIASLKGVSVVCIVSACHSGALFDNSGDSPALTGWYLANGLALCSANVAWITAAGGGTSGNGFFDEFLFDYGWNGGWAGNGGTVTFLELAEYAKRQYDGLFKGFAYEGDAASPEVQIENDGLLSRLTAGTRGSHDDGIAKPDDPSGVEASQGAERGKITVSWAGAAGADYCCVFTRTNGSLKYLDVEVSESSPCIVTNKCILDSSAAAPVRVVVRAVNGAGISESPEAEGWVSTLRTVTFYCRCGVPGAWKGIEPTAVHEPGETEVWGYVSAELEKGSTLGTLPEAEREGYTLVRWINGDEVAMSGTVVTDDVTYSAEWTDMTRDWLAEHPDAFAASGGDVAVAATMMAANGKMTVAECYALGIDPDDKDDGLRIEHFDLVDGKPMMTLNHTENGSGKSFLPNVRTFGATALGSMTDWCDVTDVEDVEAEGWRFFRVGVDLAE
jgi:hypothetical protein